MAHIIAGDSVRTKAMRRESARVEETLTTPELAKDFPGNRVSRRMWEPGAGGWRPGGSVSA